MRQRGPAALHDALHLARVLAPAHADVARVRQAADGLHESLPQRQHDGQMLATTTFSPISDILMKMALQPIIKSPQYYLQVPAVSMLYGSTRVQGLRGQ